tara:strand:- start:121 stop:753 length:633 start_codon:yes stop_codon:yes gene_type:complete
MSDNLDPKAVEAFLRAHPNFLQDRPGLLAVLNLPHGGEGAVSLVERQVSVLRERNIASRQKLAELSDISRENDRLLDATRNTILALLAGENRADLSRIWLDQVTGTFKAEMGALVWLDRSSDSAEEALITDKLVRQSSGFSGVLRPEEMQAVFGTAATEGSAALVAIRSGEDHIGVLGVGSHDTQRYRPEDGTLFLDYLAEVIGQLPATD